MQSTQVLFLVLGKNWLGEQVMPPAIRHLLFVGEKATKNSWGFYEKDK